MSRWMPPNFAMPARGDEPSNVPRGSPRTEKGRLYNLHLETKRRGGKGEVDGVLGLHNRAENPALGQARTSPPDPVWRIHRPGPRAQRSCGESGRKRLDMVIGSRRDVAEA
jgi:hypothetical protein